MNGETVRNHELGVMWKRTIEHILSYSSIVCLDELTNVTKTLNQRNVASRSKANVEREVLV
jgi:hypothetical protein